MVLSHLRHTKLNKNPNTLRIKDRCDIGMPTQNNCKWYEIKDMEAVTESI